MFDERRLEQLLDLWEDLQAGENPPTLNEFIECYCADEPLELLLELRDRGRAVAAVDALLAGPEERLGDQLRTDDYSSHETGNWPLRPGSEVVPGYRLMTRLGQGGFGEVWKAWAPGGFQVTLKFVKLDRRASEAELRALALARRLRHPHLVAIFGAWEHDGWLIVAMELAGRSLWERFRECVAAGRNGIPPGELLSYLADVAKVLDFLNGRKHFLGNGRYGGIQHRDVKPQNLLLCGGSVKLADLGIATLLEGSTGGHTGMMSLTFAAPEFFDGKTSARSDQYGLAVTYTLLRCGRAPFSGTDLEVMKGHVEGSPDLSLLPEEERPIVARALSKRPDDRWPTSTAFVRALMSSQLRSVAISHDATEGSAEGSSTRMFTALTLMLALMVAIGLTVLWMFGLYQPPRIPQKEDWEFPQVTGDDANQQGGGIPAEAGVPPPLADQENTNASSPETTAPAAPPGLSWPDNSLLIAPFSEEQAIAARTATAALLGIPETTTNSIGMELTLIPAGEFLMGSTPAEVEKVLKLDTAFRKKLADDEQPQHRVRITRPFYLGIHEVTKGQFAQFVAATNYRTEPERDGQGGYGFNESTGEFEGRNPKYTWRNTGFAQDDIHPVVNVTWNDAVAFCEWLSWKEGRTYRLPTEAEWEYACRGGTTTLWQHGDDPEGLARVGNVADGTAKAKFASWSTMSARDGYVFTAPVGRFQPNAFVLYDLHGNVWEWCADWNDPGYYATSPSADPPGPLPGLDRVHRGGSWFDVAWICRSANRGGLDPSFRSCNLGFRCALSPSGE